MIQKDKLMSYCRCQVLSFVFSIQAPEVLRVIQLNTLEDRNVHDKYQWDSAVKFLEECIRAKLKVSETLLRQMVGPGAWERWIRWKYATDSQYTRSMIKTELDQILLSDPVSRMDENTREYLMIGK